MNSLCDVQQQQVSGGFGPSDAGHGIGAFLRGYFELLGEMGGLQDGLI